MNQIIKTRCPVCAERTTAEPSWDKSGLPRGLKLGCGHLFDCEDWRLRPMFSHGSEYWMEEQR